MKIKKTYVIFYIHVSGTTEHYIMLENIEDELWLYRRIYEDEGTEFIDYFMLWGSDQSYTFLERSVQLGWVVLSYAITIIEEVGT